eukprot:558747-Rhodomonas_salina.1
MNQLYALQLQTLNAHPAVHLLVQRVSMNQQPAQTLRTANAQCALLDRGVQMGLKTHASSIHSLVQ